MNVNEVACVVTEVCCAPNAIAGKKTSHLRNKSWLLRNNLVDRRPITRLSFAGTPNAATDFVLPVPWAAMRLAKLAGNTQGWFCLTSEDRSREDIPSCQLKQLSKRKMICDDASSAVLAERVRGYMGRPILGRPPSKSQAQSHCGSLAEWKRCWRNQAGPRNAHDSGESQPLSRHPNKGYGRGHQAWLPCRPSLPASPCHPCT